MKNPQSKPLYWIIISLIVVMFIKSPAVALCLGCGLSMIWGNHVQNYTGKWAKYLLQMAVILLGFGLQLTIILKVGLASIGITLFSITITLLLGLWLGKIFKVQRELSWLISSGTAICGGSAIAAMAPAIGASQKNTGIAMAVVFLLNGLALLVFPAGGHWLGLNQTDFGMWSALAIHDTSSVVGATAIYGTRALAIGTTIKLTRALWIMPLSFLAARFNRTESRAKFPWFLLGFLFAALLRFLFPGGDTFWNSLAAVGKQIMVITLFLVGAGITRGDLKKIGTGPLLNAVILWFMVSVITLAAILLGCYHLDVPID